MRPAHSYQALICLSVRQVVSDVREPRAARLELLNEGERLLHRLVHGMWSIPQSVQHELVESLEQRHRRIRNLAEVGQIGDPPEPESQNFHLTVEQRHRNKRDAEKFKGALDVDRSYPWHAAERRFVIEDVSKDATDDAESFFVGVDGERRPLTDIEGANVVEAENVVGVTVGPQDGVEAL